jgi:glycine/D-amino acid oxidase-like deaminating enzyme
MIEEKLQRVFKKPYQILSSQTGVRPILHRRQALLGFHPALNRIGFFNGLGSKGVLRAPWLSRHLIEHLLLGQPIEDELDLRANL